MGNYRVLAALIAYLALAWVTATLLHLKTADFLILWGGLALLGVIGAGAFLWFQHRLRADTLADPEPAPGDAGIDLIVRDATRHLKTSKIAREWKLGKIPVLYLVGDTGSTKTSVIAHSGLDPELLAGHVYHDDLIVPTRGANLWYTRQALLVDPSGSLFDRPALWGRLVKRLQPSRFAAACAGHQAPQAALVCVDCDVLLHAGSEAIGRLSRKLSGALQEISRVLGIEFPVYVVFTRTDRIPYFAEYVRSLSKEEGSQAFGVTLPLSARPAGVYAEQQTRQLTQSFDELFCCAAGMRVELLARETGPENLAGIYQFPRELRKLRRDLVQFLVDLVRPSQLSSTPFLRGFYFCGARAAVIEETVSRPQPEVTASRAPDATMAFRFSDLKQAAAPAPAPAKVCRKVPEWMFLTHLFSDVVLKDQAALGTSGVSSKISLARRISLAVATCLCLTLSAGFLVSFVGNRRLQAEADQAIRSTPNLEVAAGRLPSPDDLNRLESLRQNVEKLGRYERDGAPLYLRWGLFTGHHLYPGVRNAYFDRLHKILLKTTQADLIATLQRLPAAPSPSDDYDGSYKALKAYLIMTSHHDKSTVEFLAPVLMSHSVTAQQADMSVSELVRKQFEFYAAELKLEDPYSFVADAATVERARNYLAQFAGSERLYRFMLGEASRLNAPVSYNRMFPGSSEVIVATREVEGAFTKAGWNYVQDALAHLDRLFAGEEWVLGATATFAIDRAKLQQELQAKYRADFVQRWREFLEGASVVRYGGPKDAARKLGIFASNQSPLLALFSIVSRNTDLDEAIAAKFQPTLAVMPAGSGDRYVAPANASYMTALIGLQTAMEQVASVSSAGNDPSTLDPARNAAANAKQAAYQMAQGFTVDATNHIDVITRRLLEAPVQYAEDALNDAGTGDLNGNARKLCAQFRGLREKYPFNSKSGQQVSVEELNAIFKPRTGALWMFYDQSLQAMVQRRGASFVPGAKGANLNPDFLAFFNRAAAFSELVYGSDGSQPRLTFKLKPQSMAKLQALTLDIGGQTVGASGGAKQFAWQWGDRDQVKLVGKMGGTEFAFLSYNGPWSVFQFFASAERSQAVGSAQRYEWVPKTSGQPFMVGGKSLTVSYELEMREASIFQKGYFAQMQCVSRATR